MLQKKLPMQMREDSVLRVRPGMVAVALGVLIIVGYTLYAGLPYLLGSALTVSETTIRGITTVSGATERVAFLSVDGAPVPLQEDGSFSVERAYPLGYTAVVVSVRDRFGRTLTKTLTFLNPVP